MDYQQVAHLDATLVSTQGLHLLLKVWVRQARSASAWADHPAAGALHPIAPGHHPLWLSLVLGRGRRHLALLVWLLLLLLGSPGREVCRQAEGSQMQQQQYQ